MKQALSFLLLIFTGSVSGLIAQKDLHKKIQTQLILAEDGATIQLDEGVFTLPGSLSLDGKKNVTVKGKGMGRTVLSFKGQTDGAEGILITDSENITLEGLSVQDSKGDAVKARNVRGITFRNVRAEWTGKPAPTNGAYGLYPVQCENVLIESCEAEGASDAGIYVGQSRHIVVRNSKAVRNVAGIEIENSLFAEVYDNEATQNTGGILVFDLPDLVLKKGGFVKVYRNHIHDNNFPNFAPKGNIVAKVPDGTGILVLATGNVEISENRIINNKTMGTGIFSYFMTENPIADTAYYPYPAHIGIYNNVYARENVKPTMKGRIGKLFRFKLKFGKAVPHILWDGIRDKASGEKVLCISGNSGETFANMDAANGFRKVSRDLKPVQCKLPSMVFSAP